MSKTEIELEQKYKTQRRCNWRRVLLGLFLILLLAGSGCWYYINRQMQPFRPGAPAVELEIPAGASTAAIAAILVDHGLIADSYTFRLAAALSGLDRQLKSGHYTISPGLSLPEILQLLVEGQVQELEFTVPEGYTLKQIEALLQQKGLVQADEFRQAAADEYDFEFLTGLEPGAERLEGFLYPDTYRVTPETTPRQIIMMMLERFDQVYQEVYAENDISQKYNTREMVTLASIIEREARLDEERPLVASVFINRLNRGMRLESCATVEYLLPEIKPVLTLEDLKIDSPYNTYRVEGLPPGPIANPGKESLLAAFNPAQSDYLYFVAKPDGSHHFSRTLSEHNQAASRYQQ